jgi:hypothetical protein
MAVVAIRERDVQACRLHLTILRFGCSDPARCDVRIAVREVLILRTIRGQIYGNVMLRKVWAPQAFPHPEHLLVDDPACNVQRTHDDAA